MYSFSKLHWYEKTHLGKQNHTKNYWNIKCAWQSVLWPNHTLARCVFFYQYCLRGNWYIIYAYMCHSNFIVLLPHISPWTQIWIQAFIVAYQNLTFKSVKQNCCFRNQRWDAVKSRQALKKGCIKSTNQNAIFFARIYQTPIWIGTKINLFLIGIFTNQ